jgi:hypothetical protein
LGNNHRATNGSDGSSELRRRWCCNEERIMWSWADRVVKAVSDVTVGTVIVLVHVALAERDKRPQQILPAPRRIAN